MKLDIATATPRVALTVNNGYGHLADDEATTISDHQRSNVRRGQGAMTPYESVGAVCPDTFVTTPNAPSGGKFTHTPWSDWVVDSSNDCSSNTGTLGLRFRGLVHGPEQRLVDAFLNAATSPLPPGRRLTVFAQPALETGFPDLVAVIWNTSVARRWCRERERLRGVDLRLLHLLATTGAMDVAFLSSAFQRGLMGMLARLEEAGVIVVGKTRCRARPISQIFAVERIIAIEAKVSATRRVLEQASANTWFSSESHALLPGQRSDTRLKEMATALGVGVVGLECASTKQVHEATVRNIPLSYGSWLFNEWTWRIARDRSVI